MERCKHCAVFLTEKIYKTEEDFGGWDDYASYVYQQLKPGMTVKATGDLTWYCDVKTGDTGVVVGTMINGFGNHRVNVRWRRVGHEVNVWSGYVEIVE